MSMFANVSRDGAAPAEDRVYTGAKVLDSDYYEGTIKLAFGGISSSGAKNVTLHIDVAGTEFRETLYITTKDGESLYVDKRDNLKKALPGLILIDDLCLLTTSKALGEQRVETKHVKLYNAAKRVEELMPVEMLVDLLGKTARFCLLRETVDQQSKDSEGRYVNNGKTRDQNALDKFLWTDGRTVTEVQKNVPNPVYKETWLSTNKGKTRNRAKGVEGNTGIPGQAGAPRPLFGTPAGAGAAEPPKPSGLFGA